VGFLFSWIGRYTSLIHWFLEKESNPDLPPADAMELNRKGKNGIPFLSASSFSPSYLQTVSGVYLSIQ